MGRFCLAGWHARCHRRSAGAERGRSKFASGTYESPKINETGSSDLRATLYSDRNRHSFVDHLIATSVRTVHAVWLAPVLLFAILAPQQTGACAELLALRASGSQLPPWLIGMVIIGHLSLLWWFIVFFGLPWVVSGAAAQIQDHLIPPEHRRGYVAHANKFYGRTFALLILLGVAFVALFVPLYALPMWLMTRNDGVLTGDDAKLVISTAAHPAMLACTIAWWLATAVAVTACNLVLATMAVEDLDLIRAVRRVLSFVRDHSADAVRLWLFVVLIGLPDVLIQQTLVLVPIPAIPLFAIAIGTAAYNAYAITLAIAVAEALYLARRPMIAAG